MTTNFRSVPDSAPPPPLPRESLPRDLPSGVRWSLWLGGASGMTGWAVFGFGMIFFWLFAMNADVAGTWQFAGEKEVAAGQVTGVSKTSFTSGGGKRRKGKPVFAHEYSFRAPDGVERYGVSYQTDRNLSAGSAVQVEYPKGRPEVSRIVGMRRAPMGAPALAMVLIPLAGLGIIAAAWWAGRRAAYLLE